MSFYKTLDENSDQTYLYFIHPDDTTYHHPSCNKSCIVTGGKFYDLTSSYSCNFSEGFVQTLTVADSDYPSITFELILHIRIIVASSVNYLCSQRTPRTATTTPKYDEDSVLSNIVILVETDITCGLYYNFCFSSLLSVLCNTETKLTQDFVKKPWPYLYVIFAIICLVLVCS